VTIGFRLKNAGSERANPFHLQIYRNGSKICDWIVDAGLNPGETFQRGPGVGYGSTCFGIYGVPNAQPPGYTVRFEVDDLTQITEINEDDNFCEEYIPVGGGVGSGQCNPGKTITPFGGGGGGGAQCDVQAIAGESHRFRATSDDPDQDDIYYTFIWGDNQTTRMPASGYVSSGVSEEGTHAWGSNGTYVVAATATDAKGDTSLASNAIRVCVGSGQGGGSGSGGGSSDINGDGKVDILDLKILLDNWGTPTDPKADLNGDGRVDILDFVKWLADWLARNPLT